jgi:hypothetical protein
MLNHDHDRTHTPPRMYVEVFLPFPELNFARRLSLAPAPNHRSLSFVLFPAGGACVGPALPLGHQRGRRSAGGHLERRGRGRVHPRRIPLPHPHGCDGGALLLWPGPGLCSCGRGERRAVILQRPDLPAPPLDVTVATSFVCPLSSRAPHPPAPLALPFSLYFLCNLTCVCLCAGASPNNGRRAACCGLVPLPPRLPVGPVGAGHNCPGAVPASVQAPHGGRAVCGRHHLPVQSRVRSARTVRTQFFCVRLKCPASRDLLSARYCD